MAALTNLNTAPKQKNLRIARWLPDISAGDLRTYGEIQNVVKTTLPSGNVEDNWVTIDGVWADILPFSPERYFFGAQVTDESIAYVKLRYRTDIKIGMRFVTENNIFMIFKEPLDLDYRHISILLYCKQF